MWVVRSIIVCHSQEKKIFIVMVLLLYLINVTLYSAISVSYTINIVSDLNGIHSELSFVIRTLVLFGRRAFRLSKFFNSSLMIVMSVVCFLVREFCSSIKLF